MGTVQSEGHSSPDWGMLIFEIQTDPSGSERCPALDTLFQALFPFLRNSANRWKKQKCVSEANRDELAMDGWYKIVTEIGKFQVPDDTPARIGFAFKAWVARCCQREWQRQVSERREVSIDPMELSDSFPVEVPSPESVMLEEEGAGEALAGATRSQRHRELGRSILKQALDAMPPNIRAALLESEDTKSVSNPNARGTAGETEAIARKWGTSPGAVRTQRTRLIAKVRDLFNAEVAHGE